MAPARHPDRSTVLAFRDAETAQVWAEDRETGEPRYIGRGQADGLRQTAKARWRCPVPDCADYAISTRGGSRRDHFFHLVEGAGHSDGESLQHLQAKAMLAAWARRRAPEADVAEERSVKDPATRRDRRPDVLAQWPDGRRIAFEVEYKSWSVAGWRAKQDDFDAHDRPVRAVWLFGHLPRYLAQPPRPAHVPESGWDQVLIRELPRAVAAAGMPVLHVNPLDRTVGTVIVDGPPLAEVRSWRRWYETQDLSRVGLRLPGQGDDRGRLVVCDLDECGLDPDQGLLTPVMSQVAASSAAVAKAAAEDRARDDEAARKAEAKRRSDQEQADQRRQREERPVQDRRAYAKKAAERDLAAWGKDPLRQALIGHYGKVPPLLAEELDDDRGVFGHPAHWHCVAFRDLVRGQVGRTWTVKQVYAVIAQSFRLHPDPMRRGPAIGGFLRHLDDHGIVEFDEGYGAGGTVRVLSDDPMPVAPPRLAARPSPPPPMVQEAESPRDSRERARRIRLQAEAARAAPREGRGAGATPTPEAAHSTSTADRLQAAGLTPEAAAALAEIAAD